jgi:hypothetical protein
MNAENTTRRRTALAAIDKIKDPRVKKERKLYVGKKWRVERRELVTSEDPPIQATFYVLLIDGKEDESVPSSHAVLDWSLSRFLEGELYVWLTGATRYIVLRKEDEEGYAPPTVPKFGPTPVPGVQEDDDAVD